MLQRAGFPDAIRHDQIQLGKPLGSTSPDCFFYGEDEEDPGTCVYLDGLREHIHGNDETREKDRVIREELRARHYWVLEIAANALYDREKMRHFFNLGQILVGKEMARGVRNNPEWFEAECN